MVSSRPGIKSQPCGLDKVPLRMNSRGEANRASLSTLPDKLVALEIEPVDSMSQHTVHIGSFFRIHHMSHQLSRGGRSTRSLASVTCLRQKRYNCR